LCINITSLRSKARRELIYKRNILIFQKNHRAIVQARLQDIHAEIVSTMKQVHTVFKNDGPEVSTYTVCHTSLKFRKNKGMFITMHAS
jgi:hypothetical protein